MISEPCSQKIGVAHIGQSTQWLGPNLDDLVDWVELYALVQF